jgi:hypothetical protein
MPAAVSSWARTRSLEEMHQIHHELLATYYDDFSKYAGKISPQRLQETLNAVPKMLGEKCVYSHISSNASSAQMKQTVDLLAQARLVHRVYHSHGNGVPLTAKINVKFYDINSFQGRISIFFRC